MGPSTSAAPPVDASDAGPGASGEAGTGSPTLTALQLLEAMMRREGDWGVSELAASLGLARGRVHRHLALLTDAGYLARNAETRRYDLGWRLVLLARGITERSQLVRVAQPVMEELGERLGQTVVFSQLTDSGVVVTETASGGSLLGLSFPPGTTYAYNSSAQGKVGLAFADAAQKERWARVPFETRTPATITDPEVIWTQVAQTRERGWATAPEETFEGMNAVAVPVLGHGGVVLGTLGIVAPGSVIPEVPLPHQLGPLLEAAREISLRLGCAPADVPEVLRGGGRGAGPTGRP